MASKTFKVRVAVSGQTIDGRVLTPEMLQSAASSYDFKNRAARINLNHISGYSAEPPFNAYGDVLSAETKVEEMSFNGKKEKVTALYVEIEPNQQLIDLNKKGQALYTSIELWPNYRGKDGVWALGGLAVTDTPAAFGTDRLQFSTLPNKLDGVEFSTALEAKFYEPETENQDKVSVSAIASIADIFKSFLPKSETPKVEDKSEENDFSKFAATIATGMTKLSETLSASVEKIETEVSKNATELAALKTAFENQKAQNHTPRPQSTGSEGAKLKADC